MKLIKKTIDVNAHIVNLTADVLQKDGKPIALVSFENLGYGVITAIKFVATGYNAFSDTIRIDGQDSFFLVAQDLRVEKNTVIKDVVFDLPSSEIKRLVMQEAQICFEDGSIVSYNGEEIEIIETEEFEEDLDSDKETIRALRDMVSSKIMYIPQKTKTGWLCACGRYNDEGQMYCSKCDISKEEVFNIADPKFVELVKQQFEQREANRAEQARLEVETRKEEKKREIIRNSVAILALVAVIGFAILVSILSNRISFKSEAVMKDELKGTYTYYNSLGAGTEQIILDGDEIVHKLRSGQETLTTVDKWEYRTGKLRVVNSIITVTKDNGLEYDGKLFEKGGSLTPLPDYDPDDYEEDYFDEEDDYEYEDDYGYESYENGYDVLEVTIDEVYSNSSYVICTGSVKNTGSKTYTFVTVKGAFKDTNGNVIDTDWTYAVGPEGLEPGESSNFRLSVDRNNSIDSCSVSLLEYKDW